MKFRVVEYTEGQEHGLYSEADLGASDMHVACDILQGGRLDLGEWYSVGGTKVLINRRAEASEVADLEDRLEAAVQEHLQRRTERAAADPLPVGRGWLVHQLGAVQEAVDQLEGMAKQYGSVDNERVRLDNTAKAILRALEGQETYR